jgi:hypothetical protein
MQPVLAALASRKRGPRNAAATELPPLVVAAFQTLVEDTDVLIPAITVSHPVSSLENGDAIGSAIRRVGFEHNLAVEVTIRVGHVRVRLSRLTPSARSAT